MADSCTRSRSVVEQTDAFVAPGPGKTFSSSAIRRLLEQMGIEFHADAREIDGLCFKSLRQIEPRGIYFVEGLPPAELVDSLVLCTSREGFDASNVLVLVAQPQLVFYRLMRSVYEGARSVGSIHPTAVVDDAARLGEGVEIGPYCVIGAAILAHGVRLRSHVVVMDGCTIGANTVVEPHSTLGASGVAWAWDPATDERIVQPQIGGVVIGRDCFIGTDVSIVRGSVNENTVIGDGTVIAHGTKIGHGCRVGPLNHFANNVSLAGNVTTGERCFFGSACVVRPMVTLCADTTVGAGAVVVGSVAEPHQVLMGVPAKASKPANAKLSGVPRSPTRQEG